MDPGVRTRVPYLGRGFKPCLVSDGRFWSTLASQCALRTPGASSRGTLRSGSLKRDETWCCPTAPDASVHVPNWQCETKSSRSYSFNAPAARTKPCRLELHWKAKRAGTSSFHLLSPKPKLSSPLNVTIPDQSMRHVKLRRIHLSTSGFLSSTLLRQFRATPPALPRQTKKDRAWPEIQVRAHACKSS